MTMLAAVRVTVRVLVVRMAVSMVVVDMRGFFVRM